MVKVEKLSENSVKLTITVSSEEFDAALDKAFEVVVKEVKVDGFRPGKMPKSMFVKRFGWEALYEEACNNAINKTYPLALNEAKVYPTAEPKIEVGTAPEKGKGFEYTATVDVWPEVRLGEYKNIKVKKATVRVTKKDVEEEINKKLNEKAENVIKEGAAEKGDTVVIDFEGSIDGVPFEGGKGENYSLVLGSNSFVPGFEDQLVGTKANDEKDVTVTFPENYHEGLSGKVAVFKCIVHEVKNKVVPTLDDEFVKELDIEGVETVEAYNEHVKAEIKSRKTKEAESNFENDCVNTVCEASYAEFPESLIASGVAQEVKRVEMQAKQYNIPVEVLLQYMGTPSLEEFKKIAENQVRKNYLSELVFDAIIQKENIEATEEEINAKYLSICGGDAEKVKQAKKQYSEYQVAFQVKIEKAVQLIKDNVAK